MSEIISRSAAKAEHWRKLLDEQVVSGQSACGFCRERGINRKTFYYWRRKFCGSSLPVAKRSSRFVAVAHPHDLPSGSPRIRLPNGVIIDLGCGLDSVFANQFLLNLCGIGVAPKE